MATGKVLQFDHDRGYGFLAADDGGEDLFLHASSFNGDPAELFPGVSLEFQVMSGDRGRKAYAACFTEERPMPKPSALAAPTILATQHTPLTVSATQQAPLSEEEQMCDVLSQAEFRTELTEMLLKTIPALNGPQISEVRQGLLEFAKNHGWVDA